MDGGNAHSREEGRIVQICGVRRVFVLCLSSCSGSGKTAVLLHGRNFCGPTWNVTAGVLSSVGYRVILPDQVGFCKSTKPDSYQYSLQQLAANTLALLKILQIEKVTLIGHSMGGMLGTRFSLMYPANVTELVLVNPSRYYKYFK